VRTNLKKRVIPGSVDVQRAPHVDFPKLEGTFDAILVDFEEGVSRLR
jgi:hypothetical protein